MSELSKQTDNGTPFKDVTKGAWNNRLGRTGRDRDFLYVAKSAKSFSGKAENLRWNTRLQALETPKKPRRDEESSQLERPLFARYTSPVVACRFPATEFLPSWNISVSLEGTFKIYLRVIDVDGQESPWFFMGEGNYKPGDSSDVILDDAWGKVHIDYLELKREAAAFQYRVNFLVKADKPADATVEIHQMVIHYSGQARRHCRNTNSPGEEKISVSVPYRSQLDVPDEELRHVICSPTCVAMVMEFLGVNRETMDVCEAVYDPRHKLYGLWPRAAQAAFHFGLRAWVQRFRHFNGARAWLMSGRPIIASIRVGEGDLRGARYPTSNGHLIVIRGFTESGKVLVNDPYSAGPGGAEIEYESEDIEKVWLDRGGVAILIEKRESR